MSLKDINAFEEDPTASYTADSDFLPMLCHFFRRHSRPGGSAKWERLDGQRVGLNPLHEED